MTGSGAGAATPTPAAGGIHDLSGREAVLLVARREFVARFRDKSFAISTGFVLLLVAGIVLVPRLLGFGEGATYDVGLAGPGSGAVGETLAGAAVPLGRDVALHSVPDEVEGEALVAAGELDLLVVDGRALVVEREGDAQLIGLVQAAVREQRLAEELAGAGVDSARVREVLAPEPLPVRGLEPVDPHEGARTGIAFIGLMILYGQLFGYGFAVASGVVEEKSSRVVEILLSTVRPTHLLAGKVIGIGALGLVQLVLVAGLALALVVATGTVELPPGTAPLILQLIGWFLLGYALYSCLFAGVAALVSRIEELQSVMTPFTLVILVSFFASFAALNDPTSTLARVVSLVPLSAPLAMPIRVAQQAAAGWEIALAVGLLVATILVVVPIGARLYRGGALRTGGTMRFREAWRSA